MKNKKVLVILGILVLVAVLFLFGLRQSKAPSPAVSSSTPETVQNQATTTLVADIVKDNPPAAVKSPKDAAWAVFEKYLSYSRDGNLSAVKGTVYKVAPVCDTAEPSAECLSRMKLAWQYGSALAKSDFVNVWSDSRQVILATDFKVEEEGTLMSRNRAIIFFIKDGGVLKMLSFSPVKGVTIDKGEASKKELDDRLVTYTADEDHDGLFDYNEPCLALQEGVPCLQTDPKLQDSDSDGLWDGVEALMK